VTRSREDARQLLQDLAQDLRAGEITFEHLALKRSDCSSAKRGGDLGESPACADSPLPPVPLHIPRANVCWQVSSTLVKCSQSSLRQHSR
jgi:hypothetical protein